MNILLLIVGIIFLVSVFIGYKRGFVKIAASLITTLLCFVLVLFISPFVSQWIQKSTPLKGIIQDKCMELLLPDEGAVEDVMQVEVSSNEQFEMIKDTEWPEILQDMIWEHNNSEVYSALGVETFIEYIGAYITKIIADILAFLITFIVVFIVLRIIVGMLNIVDKIPLVGGVNRTVGAVLGAGVGVLIIWILFIVITLLYNTEIGALCLESIAENKILTELYERNWLMNNITKF